MLAIKNNLMAGQAARQLGKSYDNLSKSVGRLSSGLRINSAGDDAAGMAVRELIRADVATLRQGSRNAHDAISMLQTSEGALSVVDDILVRMKELAEQASTESYSSDQRAIMDQEFSQLINEIDRISENTSFNGLKLLDATTETLDIHLGSAETFALGTKDMSAAGLGLGGIKSSVSLSVGRVTDINTELDVTDGDVLYISFGAQTDLVVSFTGTGDSKYSLSEIVDSINAKSRDTLSQEYNAASVDYKVDSAGNGTYGIKITAMWGAVDNSITLSYSNNANSMDSSGGDGNWSAVIAGTQTRISIGDSTSAIGALNTLSAAIQTKDEYRAKMGYMMNRLESAISVIDIQAENLLAAESRISDVDVATEMANMTKNQVLAQAGISMLSQANTMPQMALTLLQ